MFKLIIKDLKSGWIFLFGIVIVIAFLLHMMLGVMMDDFGGVSIPFLTFFVMICCIATSLLFITIDETFKTNATFASLPVARCKIVCARYVTSFFITTFAFLIVLLSCYSIVHVFNGQDPAFKIILSLQGIGAMLAFMFIVLSCIMPFIFTFGTGKGLIIALSTLVGIQLISTIITFVIRAFNGVMRIDLYVVLKLFNSGVRWLSALKPQELYMILVSAVVVIVLLSMGVSVFFYNKLDLELY